MKTLFFVIFLCPVFALSAPTCDSLLKNQIRSVSSVSDSTHLNLRLLNKIKVEYTLQEFRFSGPTNPLDKTSYNIFIHPKNEEEFDLIKREFGSLSQVKWVKNKTYLLSDFLSPGIQALIHKRFDTVEEKNLPWVEEEFSDFDDRTVRMTTNCYGTIWELVRLGRFDQARVSSKFYLFWANQDPVIQVLTDPVYGAEVKSENIMTGDVALFFEKVTDDYSRLLHAAMVIDGELYFEKTDTGSEFAYRFVKFNDIQAKLFQSIDSKDLEVRHYRYNQVGQERLPLPTEALSVPFDPMFQGFADIVPENERSSIIIGLDSGAAGKNNLGIYRIGHVDISLDPITGRGVLSSKSPTARNFKNLLLQKSN